MRPPEPQSNLSLATLKTVTGATAPILGCGRLQLSVGAFNVPHDMWVAEVANKCILGLDFLEHHKCHVDLGEGILHVNHQQIPLQKPSKVIASRQVDLPPCLEVVVPTTAVDTLTSVR